MKDERDDTGRRLHIRLRNRDLAVLDHIKAKYGLTRSAAIRQCIEAAGRGLDIRPARSRIDPAETGWMELCQIAVGDDLGREDA